MSTASVANEDVPCQLARTPPWQAHGRPGCTQLTLASSAGGGHCTAAAAAASVAAAAASCRHHPPNQPRSNK